VAVVGLGTGSLVSYGLPDQRWTFYEIDPAMKRIAEDPQYFTFLSLARSTWSVVLGDARLSLAQAPDGAYGLIVMDAFGSDAIPAHLLTREAMELYWRKLDGEGMLVFHISNRFLDLEGPLGDVGRNLGLEGVSRWETEVTEEDLRSGMLPSRWIVFSKRKPDMFELARRFGWKRIPGRRGVRAWTDDDFDLLSAFRWDSF
jgi:hypothetical protein